VGLFPISTEYVRFLRDFLHRFPKMLFDTMLPKKSEKACIRVPKLAKNGFNSVARMTVPEFVWQVDWSLALLIKHIWIITGQQIVPPKFLRDYQPDIITVMNPIYRREIQQFTKKLGLATKSMYAGCLDSVRETEKKTMSTLDNIAGTYQKTTNQVINENQLMQQLAELEKIGILKSHIINKQDEPRLIWKTQI
jgi:hypothetical protein